MQKRYEHWDAANSRIWGKCDRMRRIKRRGRRRNRRKGIVPMTFSQVQSFASFCFLLFQQNRTFFELRGMGPEDYIHDAEAFLGKGS